MIESVITTPLTLTTNNSVVTFSVDDLRTIAECIHKDYCTVYLLTKE